MGKKIKICLGCHSTRSNLNLDTFGSFTLWLTQLSLVDWPTGKQATFDHWSHFTPTLSWAYLLPATQAFPDRMISTRNAGRTNWRISFARNMPPRVLFFFFPPDKTVREREHHFPEDSADCSVESEQEQGRGWGEISPASYSSLAELAVRGGNPEGHLQLGVKVAQSCPTVCNPRDCIVPGILQARILEWVAFSFSRGSPQPRNRI